jgi:hypothetical protein
MISGLPAPALLVPELLPQPAASRPAALAAITAMNDLWRLICLALQSEILRGAAQADW